jgi:SAM-dependent methyltransferase
MNRSFLAKLPLICVSCRKIRKGKGYLKLHSVQKEENGFIVKGKMKCRSCGKTYHISEGVLCILDRKKGARFVQKSVVSSYIHASYGGGGFGGNEKFWNALGKCARKGRGLALDLGCGMGRSTFDLAKRNETAVGLDADFQALSKAASFQREGKIEYELKIRSLLSVPAVSAFKPADNAIFVLADALDPPFPRESFETVCACNFIDSVGSPKKLLKEMDFLLRSGGKMVLASPFSWRAEVTPARNWLETEGRDAPDYLCETLRGKLLPALKLRYEITGKRTGIEWAFWSGKRHENVFFCEIISARKLRRRE